MNFHPSSSQAGSEGVLELAPIVEPGVGPAEFAHRLLSRGEIALVRGPLRRVKHKGTPPRVAAIRDMAVRATVGWLARSGGWQTRAVVAGGRRREGRLWASGIWEGLDVRFSAASIELLVRAAAASAQSGGATLGRLARAFDGIPAASTMGDIVLFHLVLEPFLDAGPGLDLSAEGDAPADVSKTPAPAPVTPPTPLPPSPRAARPGSRSANEKAASEKAASEKAASEKAASEKAASEKAAPARPDAASEARSAGSLLALSPLTALCRACDLESPATEKEDATARAAYARRFEPLVRGDRALLLTYLDDTIARRWIARESQRRASLSSTGARRYAALGAALEGLADAAQAAGRPDALRPIARFFERYLVRFGQREAVSRDLRERVHAAVPLASERASALARVARLFEASRSLESVAERILDTPFVDRTEEEKVTVADYQERLRDQRPELEAIRRELTGEVG